MPDLDELEDAHPDAWTGGVLTRGTGVDMSYALSYHAIARQIGLPAVTVTGWTSGTPHMWNRVFLEGQTSIRHGTMPESRP